MNTDHVEQTASAAAVIPSPFIDRITELLANAGHPNPTAWQAGLHPDAYITNDDSIQRFLINRQLRLILSTAPENTMDARFGLVDRGEFDDWLRLVNDLAVPCMVRHSLPR